ncbi:hypothetical protein TWF696_007688 [Orbilia brochopaga]|uniref:Uncharacterized protein n=1 Tax=Orbilia brochopaga TaxID=3140254 RepID=A0AAV9UL95_9PEZI
MASEANTIDLTGDTTEEEVTIIADNSSAGPSHPEPATVDQPAAAPTQPTNSKPVPAWYVRLPEPGSKRMRHKEVAAATRHAYANGIHGSGKDPATYEYDLWEALNKPPAKDKEPEPVPVKEHPIDVPRDDLMYPPWQVFDCQKYGRRDRNPRLMASAYLMSTHNEAMRRKYSRDFNEYRSYQCDCDERYGPVLLPEAFVFEIWPPLKTKKASGPDIGAQTTTNAGASTTSDQAQATATEPGSKYPIVDPVQRILRGDVCKERGADWGPALVLSNWPVHEPFGKKVASKTLAEIEYCGPEINFTTLYSEMTPFHQVSIDKAEYKEAALWVDMTPKQRKKKDHDLLDESILMYLLKLKRAVFIAQMKRKRLAEAAKGKKVAD